MRLYFLNRPRNWYFLQCSALKITYFLISLYDNILQEHLCDIGLPIFETRKFFRQLNSPRTSVHIFVMLEAY